MAAVRLPPTGTPSVSNPRCVEMGIGPSHCEATPHKSSLNIKEREEDNISGHDFHNAVPKLGIFGSRRRHPFEEHPGNVHNRSAMCEGFSIREYVAEVRSVDIRKCWPLSESLLEESLREGRNPQLPPLVRPNYRWWSCHRCLQTGNGFGGEHKHFGASFEMHNSLHSEAENSSGIIEQELTVSLDTFPDVAQGISEDIDERAGEVVTVQLSEQKSQKPENDSIQLGRCEDDCKNEGKRMDDPLAEENGICNAPSHCQQRHLKTEAPKCTSMSDEDYQIQESSAKNGKADVIDDPNVHKHEIVHTQSGNQIQVTFGSKPMEGNLSTAEDSCQGKGTGTILPDDVADRERTRSISLETERSKFDQLNLETNKFEQFRHNSDISNSEASVVKICPVCRTFTSATITAVNAHMDNCLAQVSKGDKKQVKMHRQKARTQKKRSIVDICAAAPPIQTMEYLDMAAQIYDDTHESADSHVMDMDTSEVPPDRADTGTANLQPTTSIQAHSETGISNSSALNCKLTRTSEAHSQLASGKVVNGEGQAESLEMKRKRQRLGITPPISGSRGVKDSVKATELLPATDLSETHQGVAHYVKHLRKTDEDSQEFNVEQPSSTQVNLEEDAIPTNTLEFMATNQPRQFTTFPSPGNFKELAVTAQPNEAQSGALTPDGYKPLECSLTDIQQGGGNGRLLDDDETHGQPEKCLITTMSNHTDKVSQLSGVEDTVPSSNGSSDAATEKPELLDDNESRHHTGDDNEISKSAKPGDQDLQNNLLPKEKNVCTSSTIDVDNIREFHILNEEQKVDISSKSSVMHFIDEPMIRPNVSHKHTEPVKSGNEAFAGTEDKKGDHLYLKNGGDNIRNAWHSQSSDRKTLQHSRANIKAVHCLPKEAFISEARMSSEGSCRNAGFNLNQKVCVLPRDSKGRFVSSARMNEEKEGEFTSDRWKQADSHKYRQPFKSSLNPPTIHNQTTFAIRAPFSDPRAGKSTFTETCIPVCNRYEGGSKYFPRNMSFPSCSVSDTVAGKARSSAGDVRKLMVCREAPLSITILNDNVAPTSENAMDLVKFCMPKRCSDYGYLGLPLDSQGELIKHKSGALTGVREQYKFQNPETGNEGLLAEDSKRFTECKFVERINRAHSVTMVNKTIQESNGSAPSILQCPPQQNYSIQNKQADCWNQETASRTNNIKHDKEGFSQSPSLGDQIPSQKLDSRNSQHNIPGSTIQTPDTSSNLPVFMHATAEPVYKGNRIQKKIAIEKTYPEAQSLQKELPTTQPVMRLMGRNFTVGGENETGHALKEVDQGKNKETQISSEATWGAPSIKKSNPAGDYVRQAKSQFPLQEHGVDICQQPRGNSNISENPQNNFEAAQSLETKTPSTSHSTDNVRKLNSSVPPLVENRFPTNYVPPRQYLSDQCYSKQIWNSIPAFCTPIANTLMSPASYLSSNTAINQGDRMPHKHVCKDITENTGKTELSRTDCCANSICFQNIPVHTRDQGRFFQNQIYIQNKDSSAGKHVCQNPECSECEDTIRNGEGASNSCSVPIQSVAGVQSLQSPTKCSSSLPQWLLNAQKQKETNEATSYQKGQPHAPMPCTTEMRSFTKQLPCMISSSGLSSDALPDVAFPLAQSSSYPTVSHTNWQTPSLTASVANSATLVQEKQSNSSTVFLESKKLRLFKSLYRNRSRLNQEKGGLIDTVEIMSAESKCPDNPKTGMEGKNHQERGGLPAEWVFQKHQECEQGSLQKSSQFPINQKQHKRKRAFLSETSPSSVTARYFNERELAQSAIFDIYNGAEMCRKKQKSVEFNIGMDRLDRGNTSNKKRTNDTLLNAPLQSGPPPNRLKSGTFTKPKNNLLECQVQQSRVGSHCPNAESSLKLAELMKLSGGAKHILKPPSQDANAKQSLPIHYTLPFVETATEAREGDLQAAYQYGNEQQGQTRGPKFVRWMSRSNSSWLHKSSNGEGNLPH